MTCSAPRVDPRLRTEARRLARRSVRAADACRLLGARAERLGVPRPSYQTVRVLLRDGTVRRLNPSPGRHVLAGRRPTEHRAFLRRIAGTQPDLQVTVGYMGGYEPAR